MTIFVVDGSGITIETPLEALPWQQQQRLIGAFAAWSKRTFDEMADLLRNTF